jgi:hypothetical protein
MMSRYPEGRRHRRFAGIADSPASPIRRHRRFAGIADSPASPIRRHRRFNRLPRD